MIEQKTHEVTVDTVIFTIRKNNLEVLLVQRGHEPFKDKWAIPGGFVRLSENLDEAAKRVLYEKTNVKDVYLEQLYTFGEPERYPSARVITVSYVALIRSDDIELAAEEGLNIQQISWHPVYKLPELAFDHIDILTYAIKRLRARLEYTPIAFQLLPIKFTLTELQRTYELVLATGLDKRNFRKKITSLGILKEYEEFTKESSKRPARLYGFNEDSIEGRKGLMSAS
ncbi:MAG TPA: NUDIX domain-containing protein [Candidatus Gastranaerophilales bacterium]|nr:NUDIX domain-containing protein [Candidatus Gastranaerophilales bacterium]